MRLAHGMLEACMCPHSLPLYITAMPSNAAAEETVVPNLRTVTAERTVTDATRKTNTR
jgi:hypothetical protein